MKGKTCCFDCGVKATLGDFLGDVGRALSVREPYLGGQLAGINVDVAPIAAQITTVAQARAALGEASKVMRRGYELLPQVSNLANLRTEIQRGLDQSNATATKVYNGLPPVTSPLDATSKRKVVEAIRFAQMSLNLVNEALDVHLDIGEGIRAVIGGASGVVGQILGAATGGLGKGLSSGIGGNIAGVLLLAGLGVGGFYVVRELKKVRP